MILMYGIAIFITVGLVCMFLSEFTDIPEALKDKKIIKKLNGKYEIFPTMKWLKNLRKNSGGGFFFININKKLLEYEEKNMIRGEKEIKMLNERIKSLTEIIENYKGGEREFLAIDKEVDTLNNDLEKGVYFAQYRKDISKEIEEIERKMPKEKPKLLSNLPNEDIYHFPRISKLVKNIKEKYPKKKELPIIKIAEEIVSVGGNIKIGEENRERINELEMHINVLLIEKEKEWRREKEKDDILAAEKIKEKMSKHKVN